MSVPGAPLVDPVDPTEHLSADDMATRQEDRKSTRLNSSHL